MPPEKDDAPTLEQIENGSIEDDLRASFAETAKGPAEAAETTEAATTPDKPEDAQDGRARDEKGRFIAKEGDQPEETPAAATKPEGEQPAVAAQPVADQPAEPEPLEPPVEWPLEKQTAFRALPPDQQKFVLEQVGGVTEKLTEVEKTGSRFKALEELFAPRREQWARDGFDEVAVVRQVLALSDLARTQPVQFARDFIAMKGLNPADLFPQMQAKQPSEPDPNDPYANDPVVQRVNQQFGVAQQRIAQLEQQLQHVTGTIQTRQQQEEQARAQRADGEIVSFSTAKDEKGNAKHPYFEMVKPLMASLFKSGQASDMESAYDMACHANPEVRAKIAAAKQYADERERARQAKDKAAAARKAGSSVSGSPVTTRSEPQSTGDVFDDLRGALAEARGASPL